MKLYDAEKANNYKANRAIFNPTDDLVLNDGVLWDVRSAQAIHKFDKFNQYVSGVFHPVGHEIIINSEIVSLILPSLRRDSHQYFITLVLLVSLLDILLKKFQAIRHCIRLLFDLEV